MFESSLFAQESSAIPQAGGGAILIWLLAAAVIVGLYVVITRTRKRSYEDFVSRSERETEIRRNDPDMKMDD